jgi:hypothetical protein
MNNNFDLEKVLGRLESDNPEEQAIALDEAVAILDRFCRAVVDRFVRCEDRFIIWERLFRLGPFLIEPLKEVFLQTQDSELRGLSAMTLLKLGDRIGLPNLLEMILTEDDLLFPVVSLLAQMQVLEASDFMIKRLKSLSFDRILHIQSLIAALERLGTSLPSDLIERFQAPDTPWEIREMIFHKSS